MQQKEVTKIISNFEINNSKNNVVIFINPKIFPVSLVNKTASAFKDDSWVTIDGDVEDEILVELRPKKNQNLDTLAREFNNKLLENSTNVKVKEEKPALVSKIRDVINQFVREEHGRISKQSIVTIGALLTGIGMASISSEVVSASHFCTSGGGTTGGGGGDGPPGNPIDDPEATGGGESSGGGSCGCCCCFVAGTKITMADGNEKNIEDIKEGDIILSFDVETKEHKPASVEGLKTPVREGIYVLNNGLVKVTNDHPLYIQKKNEIEGWGSIDPEATKKGYTSYANLNKILKLEIGDSIRTLNKEWEEVTSLQYQKGEIQTYTIKKSEFHTYFANGLVAHNC